MNRRPIYCAKNRDQMKKLDKTEDCFILEFDPGEEINIRKPSISTSSDKAGSTDYSVDTRPILCPKNKDHLKFSATFDPCDEIKISKLSISNGCNEDISTDMKDSLFKDEVGSGDVRLVLCAKNRDQMKKLEKIEDCFILQFDPYDDEIDLPKLSVSKCSNEASSADLCVVAEKGKVACRDYPHSRNNCATYPFEKTPHDRHCKMCFCYVCDSDAPCPMWLGSSGHCHAFNSGLWNEKKIERKLKVASGDYPHYRHNCTIYAFNNKPHDNHCKKCYCYVCDSDAPCPMWLGSSGHCHAFNNEFWNKKREMRILKVASGDYPHYRHNCAIYDFNNMPHNKHCKKCYCYVCDAAAPCPMWHGFSGHCHALNDESWNKKRENRKMASGDYPHYRHNCPIYAFKNTPHVNHCKKCYCYVCDKAAPCTKWAAVFGHCHAYNSEMWDKRREERKLKVSVQEKQGDLWRRL